MLGGSQRREGVSYGGHMRIRLPGEMQLVQPEMLPGNNFKS